MRFHWRWAQAVLPIASKSARVLACEAMGSARRLRSFKPSYASTLMTSHKTLLLPLHFHSIVHRDTQFAWNCQYIWGMASSVSDSLVSSIQHRKLIRLTLQSRLVSIGAQ